MNNDTDSSLPFQNPDQLSKTIENIAEQALEKRAEKATAKIKEQFQEQHAEELFDSSGEEAAFSLGYQKGFIDGENNAIEQFKDAERELSTKDILNALNEGQEEESE